MRDLSFRLDESGQAFTLIPETEDTMPPVMRAAITILFFSKINSVRSFNGEGIYSILAKLSESSLDFIKSSLTIVSADLRTILSRQYPEVTQVTIDADIQDSTLSANLIITTDKDVLQQTIKQQELL